VFSLPGDVWGLAVSTSPSVTYIKYKLFYCCSLTNLTLLCLIESNFDCLHTWIYYKVPKTSTMKFTTSVVPALFAAIAVASPRRTAGSDTLPEQSRFTAFIVDKNGSPSVECWEIAQIVESVSTHGGGIAHAVSLPHYYDAVEINTFSTNAFIWPESDNNYQGTSLDLSGKSNLFMVQHGLVLVHGASPSSDQEIAGEDDDWPDHVFSQENGDNWFYFEDNTGLDDDARRAGARPPPITIRTISGSETEVLRLTSKGQPKHRVVHKGACSFTGIKTPTDSKFHGSEKMREQSDLTVQIHIEDL